MPCAALELKKKKKKKRQRPRTQAPAKARPVLSKDDIMMLLVLCRVTPIKGLATSEAAQDNKQNLSAKGDWLPI